MKSGVCFKTEKNSDVTLVRLKKNHIWYSTYERDFTSEVERNRHCEVVCGSFKMTHPQKGFNTMFLDLRKVMVLTLELWKRKAEIHFADTKTTTEYALTLETI